MSSASCLHASDFSPLNSCLSNGFTSGGWTCGFKVMAQKPVFLAKLYWGVIFYIWYLSMPLPSSPFHPRPHHPGALSNACHIFLFRFTLWALPKLFSSPILTNAVFSHVHPHSKSQHLAPPHLALHLTFPSCREIDKTQHIWFKYSKTLISSAGSLPAMALTLQVMTPFMTPFTGGELLAGS